MKLYFVTMDIRKLKVITTEEFTQLVFTESDRTQTSYKITGRHSTEEAQRLIDMVNGGAGGKPSQLMKNGDFSCHLIEGVAVSVLRNYTETTPKEYILFQESPEYYHNIVEPHITTPKWVKNILTGTAEQETILLGTAEFLLLPDPKWDRKPENLYLLALFKADKLRSLRDLRREHIPMLQEAYRVVTQYILEKYSVDATQIRVFFHYRPSAWQLHLHFQYMRSDTNYGHNTQIGRAHLLTTILHNLSLDSNYYRDATIECIVLKDRAKT